MSGSGDSPPGQPASASKPDSTNANQPNPRQIPALEFAAATLQAAGLEAQAKPLEEEAAAMRSLVATWGKGKGAAYKGPRGQQGQGEQSPWAACS